MNELEQEKNNIIAEIYTTGRYNGEYMGVYSKSKQNPIKAYLRQWLVSKAVKYTILDDMVNDFYDCLFCEHLSKIKPEKLIEWTKNNKKLFATICTIIKRQLMQERSIGKMYIKVSYFEYINWHSGIMNKEAHTLDALAEKEDTVAEFKQRFGVGVDDIIEAMSENEKEEFYTVALKKGRVKKADLPEWTKLQMRVYESVRRIREREQL